MTKNENNDSEKMSLKVQTVLITTKEMRKEILARLKYASTLFLEILVISIALVEVSFVHGPASLLLLFPGLLLYFLILIWDQYIVIFSIGNYLRNYVENFLFNPTSGLFVNCNITGWENYRSRTIRESWIKELAFTYFIIPQLFLAIIVLYLETLPQKFIFYLKPHLYEIWIVYGLTLLLVSLFIYWINYGQMAPDIISKRGD